LEIVRVYLLHSPNFKWKERILLSEENFESFMERKGVFARPKIFKMYVVENDISPVGSPFKSTVIDGNGSQTSNNSTSRSGQRDFSEAIFRREKGSSVFCTSAGGKLEAAHYIPIEQKPLLDDPVLCVKYGIGSIVDSSNGILLCWACYKCFDAKLVCISSATGKLIISDALLANEYEKWNDLIDRVIPAATYYSLPSKELMQSREDAMTVETRKVY
jgi:hypothetical protein